MHCNIDTPRISEIKTRSVGRIQKRDLCALLSRYILRNTHYLYHLNIPGNKTHGWEGVVLLERGCTPDPETRDDPSAVAQAGGGTTPFQPGIAPIF